MKKITLATDFSERSDRALRRATLLARQFSASLLIVHVVDDDQPRSIVDNERETASTLLRKLQSSVQNIDGVPCDTRVVLADPFAGIVQATEEGVPDLLVIGSHRRQALRDVFVGTTAERTIRSVRCPVLMVNAPPVGPYDHVMLTTDLSDGARAAAKASMALGIAGHARVSILHVFDAPALHLAMSPTLPVEDRQAYLDDERKQATRNLSEFVKSINGQLSQQDVRLARSSPADELVAAAKDERAGLIVLGTHGRSGLARFFLGSVAEEVLRKAGCDVLAVPPAPTPTAARD